MPHVLMVLTSHDTLGDTGEKTGFWLEELAAPYYRFAQAGWQITLASPKGGRPPLDPKSNLEDFQTEDTRRFEADAEAQARLANTSVLADVTADDYDAVFYPGGHGPLWDLVEDADSIKLLEHFYQAGKPVAAVCHAPAVLLNVNISGQPLVADKSVTGFSNSEEAAVELTEVVPFLLEDALQEKGARYQKTAADFDSFIVADGHLYTGQNPASSAPLADRVINDI